jgi:hypothetical protein
MYSMTLRIFVGLVALGYLVLGVRVLWVGLAQERAGASFVAVLAIMFLALSSARRRYWVFGLTAVALGFASMISVWLAFPTFRDEIGEGQGRVLAALAIVLTTLIFWAGCVVFRKEFVKGI